MLNDIRASVDRSAPWGYNPADTRFEPEPRHNDGLNMGSCDGHVKWVARSDKGLTIITAASLTGTWWYPAATSP